MLSQFFTALAERSPSSRRPDDRNGAEQMTRGTANTAKANRKRAARKTAA